MMKLVVTLLMGLSALSTSALAGQTQAIPQAQNSETIDPRDAVIVVVNAGGNSSRETILATLELIAQPGIESSLLGKELQANGEYQYRFILNFVKIPPAGNTDSHGGPRGPSPAPAPMPDPNAGQTSPSSPKSTIVDKQDVINQLRALSGVSVTPVGRATTKRAVIIIRGE